MAGGAIDFGLSDPEAVYKGVANTNAMLAGFAKQKAGQYLAQGNTKAASDTLLNSGDIEGGMGVQSAAATMDANRQKHYAQMTQDVATALDNVRQTQGPQAVLDAFDHLAPVFKSNGIDDQHLGVIRQALQRDPEGTLNALSANAAERLKQYNLAPGASRYDGNGHLLATAPTEPKTMALGMDQNLVQIPGQPGTSASPAPATAPNALFPTGQVDPSTLQTAESNNDPNAVSPAGARGLMQTMPGTIKDPGFGVVPAKDDSPQELQRVGQDYLQAMQARYKNPALALIAYNWGPGNTDRWVKAGADPKLLPAETQQELIKVASRQDGSLPPMHANDTLGPGVHVIVQGKPRWRPLTDEERSMYPSGEQIDDATGKVQNAPAGASATSSMDSGTIRMYARQYMTTGQMPNLGMGSAPLRVAIGNEASKELQTMGYDGGDVAAFASDYKANSSALTDRTKNRAAIGSYEATVNKGIDYIMQIAPKALSNTGFASGNKVVNWYRQETNDPTMGELQNRIDTVVNEYARVIANATGGGVTSDTARANAEKLLNTADSPASLRAKLNTLKMEMKFRTDSLDEQIASTKAHLHAMFPKDSATQAAPKTRTYNPATGNLE